MEAFIGKDGVLNLHDSHQIPLMRSETVTCRAIVFLVLAIHESMHRSVDVKTFNGIRLTTLEC